MHNQVTKIGKFHEINFETRRFTKKSAHLQSAGFWKCTNAAGELQDPRCHRKSSNLKILLLSRKTFRRFANFEVNFERRFSMRFAKAFFEEKILKFEEMSTSLFFSENNSLEREVELQNKATKLSDIWNANELNRCIKFIREGSFARVCLQFSDEILNYSVEIEKQLKKHIDSNVFLLADTSYGSCCVDEVRKVLRRLREIFTGLFLIYSDCCRSCSGGLHHSLRACLPFKSHKTAGALCLS